MPAKLVITCALLITGGLAGYLGLLMPSLSFAADFFGLLATALIAMSLMPHTDCRMLDHSRFRLASLSLGVTLIALIMYSVIVVVFQGDAQFEAGLARRSPAVLFAVAPIVIAMAFGLRLLVSSRKKWQ